MEAKKRIKHHSILLIGVFLLLISFSLFIYDSYKYFKISENEEIKIEKFLLNDKKIVDYRTPNSTDNEIFSKNDEIKNDNNDNIETNLKGIDDYIAILEIPDINLKKGLVDISNHYNNVRYNIQIINESSYPDVDNGNFILAAHNGNDYYAYFRNLFKLEIGSEIFIYYKGFRYEYVLDKVYDIKKTGKADIIRNSNKTTITLITCKENTEDMQVVYVGYLKNVTSYN